MSSTRFKVEVKKPRGWRTNTVFNDYWLAQEDAQRLEGKGHDKVRIVAEKHDPQTDQRQRKVVYGEGAEAAKPRRRSSLGALVFTTRRKGEDQPKVHKLPLSDFLVVVCIRCAIIGVLGLVLLFFTLQLIDIVAG